MAYINLFKKIRNQERKNECIMWRGINLRLFDGVLFMGIIRKLNFRAG